MTERYGQCVGSIGRFGELLEPKLCANHELHLALIGMTVSCNTRLHFAGGVATDREPVLFGRKQNYAADFGKAQGGAHVEGGEYGLECEDVGVETADKLRKERVNVVERRTGRALLAFGDDFEGAVVNDAAGAANALDDGVAGRTGGRRIDAEDTQRGIRKRNVVHAS